MSEYDDEVARQQALVDAYNRAVARRNAAAERYNRLAADASECVQDVARTTDLVGRVQKFVLPPLEITETETDKKQVIAYNAVLAINDLVEALRRLQSSSTASKNMSGLQDKYYTLYGLYAELRNISLGYVVGLDKDFWQSDMPRKKVEKMYLANTDYWLAYATMAVMLWASDEPQACERAVSKAMQYDERKSALYFLLSALRFNRPEAAKEWYRVYFDLVELGGIGEEVICILQVLLSGALGADAEFGKMVHEKIKSLLKEATNDISARKETQTSVDKYFKAFISVTNKEYLDLKHICGEYGDMIQLLSDAEKNEILRSYFHEMLTTQLELSDRISERIEDALYSLISAHDTAEQELLDKITYEEMVVKANGNVAEAQQSYATLMAERKNDSNLALIMVTSALDPKSKADIRVKQFALTFIRDYCLKSAEEFSQYRKREKKEYDLEVDGCKLKGDENSFDANKPKLLAYYDGIIKTAVKGDKSVKTLKTAGVGAGIGLGLFLLLAVLSFVLSWPLGASISFVIFSVLCVGALVLTIIFGKAEARKIRKTFQYRINNGVKMLQDGLKQMGEWRTAYHEADAVYNELIKVLKEEVVNG